MKYGIKYVEEDGRRTSVILSTDEDGSGLIQTAHYTWHPDHEQFKIQNLKHDIDHLTVGQVEYLINEGILPKIDTWLEVTENGQDVHQQLKDALQRYQMEVAK